MVIRPLLVLLLAFCACSVERHGGGAPTGSAASAKPDLGPMAPDAAGKPVRFALDGIEMGMSFEEVKRVWGKPASSREPHLLYADKAGYAKVDLYANGAPPVLVSFELVPKEGAEPVKADAIARLTQQFGPPVTDPKELELKGIDKPEDKTLFRAARYAYAVAWWQPDFKQEGVTRLWKVVVAPHPGWILRVPPAEWGALRWPVPWAPVGALKTKVETLRGGESKPAEVEGLLGPPTRVYRSDSGYDVWDYWFWKEGPEAEFKFQDGVMYGRGVNE